MKEIDLPSGAKLKITPAPFEEAKTLYQAVLEEAKGVQFSTKDEMANVYKDLFCVGFSSKKIEAALWACFKTVIYEDKRGPLKIDKDTFTPVETRGDYVMVCMLVAKENIDPFVKGLYAEYKTLFETLATVSPA
jgi:hypothetical protein